MASRCYNLMLLVLCLLLLPIVSEANAISSENEVGYEVVSVKKGESRIILPPKPARELVALSEFLNTPSLITGDVIKVQSQTGEVMTAMIIEQDGEKHGVINGIDGFVDDWVLPFEGARQVLYVYRKEDVTTEVTRSGEYGYGDGVKPEIFPVHYSGVSVEELQISKKTADSLRSDERTNVPKINFPTMIPKKFEMIFKDGTRRLVMVDPKTRLLVDAKTSEPVSVDIGDIAGFSEAATNTVKQTQRASEKEVAEVAKEMSKAAKDYDTWQAIRKGLVGEVWDSQHPWKSVIMAVVVLGVLQFVSKAWDFVLALLSRLLLMLWRVLLSLGVKGVTSLRAILRKRTPKFFNNTGGKKWKRL